jgi:hypothetical protein
MVVVIICNYPFHARMLYILGLLLLEDTPLNFALIHMKFKLTKGETQLLGCFYLFINFFLFIYSHVHTLFGPFLLTVPPSHPSLLPGRNCSALFSNFVEEKT